MLITVVLKIITRWILRTGPGFIHCSTSSTQNSNTLSQTRYLTNICWLNYWNTSPIYYVISQRVSYHVYILLLYLFSLKYTHRWYTQRAVIHSVLQKGNHKLVEESQEMKCNDYKYSKAPWGTFDSIFQEWQWKKNRGLSSSRKEPAQPVPGEMLRDWALLLQFLKPAAPSHYCWHCPFNCTMTHFEGRNSRKVNTSLKSPNTGSVWAWSKRK